MCTKVHLPKECQKGRQKGTHASLKCDRRDIHSQKTTPAPKQKGCQKGAHPSTGRRNRRRQNEKWQPKGCFLVVVSVDLSLSLCLCCVCLFAFCLSVLSSSIALQSASCFSSISLLRSHKWECLAGWWWIGCSAASSALCCWCWWPCGLGRPWEALWGRCSGRCIRREKGEEMVGWWWAGCWWGRRRRMLCVGGCWRRPTTTSAMGPCPRTVCRVLPAPGAPTTRTTAKVPVQEALTRAAALRSRAVLEVDQVFDCSVMHALSLFFLSLFQFCSGHFRRMGSYLYCPPLSFVFLLSTHLGHGCAQGNIGTLMCLRRRLDRLLGNKIQEVRIWIGPLPLWRWSKPA